MQIGIKDEIHVYNNSNRWNHISFRLQANECLKTNQFIKKLRYLTKGRVFTKDKKQKVPGEKRDYL